MKTIFGSRAGFKGRRGRRWRGMRGLVSGDTTLKRELYCRIWRLNMASCCLKILSQLFTRSITLSNPALLLLTFLSPLLETFYPLQSILIQSSCCSFRTLVSCRFLNIQVHHGLKGCTVALELVFFKQAQTSYRL